MNWYKIINVDEFEALDVPSRELVLDLQGVGVSTVMVTKGNLISLVYDDVLLTPNLGDNNPFEFGGYAAAIDTSNDLYLGIEADES